MTMKVKNDEIPWISPMLVVKDVEASLRFYADAFGFEPGASMPDEESGKITYADMMYKGEMALMMMPEQSWGSPAQTPALIQTRATPAMGAREIRIPTTAIAPLLVVGNSTSLRF